MLTNILLDAKGTQAHHHAGIGGGEATGAGERGGVAVERARVRERHRAGTRAHLASCDAHIVSAPLKIRIVNVEVKRIYTYRFCAILQWSPKLGRTRTVCE